MYRDVPLISTSSDISGRPAIRSLPLADSVCLSPAMKSASLALFILSHFGLLAQAQRVTTNAKCGANGNTCLGSSQYLAPCR
jgi:hypothetical protein